jgi:hypothetical protein
VRLFTRNGNDWTTRYPLIIEAALRNRQTSFVIDGEAVLLGVEGISDFNGLHSRKYDDEVMLYAFDILALDGDDLRKLPLHLRKNNLARLLARARGHFCQRVRAGRDRPGPVPASLQVRAGGASIEASREHLSRGPIAKLDQGQEPKSSDAAEGQGVLLVNWVRQSGVQVAEQETFSEHRLRFFVFDFFANLIFCT